MIVRAIVSILLQAPAVAALVQNRINPVRLPQQSTPGAGYPYIIAERRGASHVRHFLGRAGLAATRIEIICFALLYADSEVLADNVRQVLDGFRGTSFGDLYWLQGIFVEDDLDEYVPPVHADELGIQGAALQIVVWHNEN